MTQREINNWYKSFAAFSKSRMVGWTPKVYKEIIAIIRHATDHPSIETAIAELDTSIKMQGLAQVIQNIYIDAGRVMGGKAYQLVKQDAATKALLPIGYNDELINEIIAFMRAHNLVMVTEITDTLKNWILEQLIQGQQDGKSIQQVRDEIVKMDFPKNRAIVIARTEVIKSVNYGAMQGARKSGFKLDKIWVSARDNRTRRLPRDAFSHVAMNGVKIPIDEPFKVPSRSGGIEELMQPGDPNGSPGDIIQCRCAVVFKVVRDAQGLPVKA